MPAPLRYASEVALELVRIGAKHSGALQSLRDDEGDPQGAHGHSASARYSAIISPISSGNVTTTGVIVTLHIFSNSASQRSASSSFTVAQDLILPSNAACREPFWRENSV